MTVYLDDYGFRLEGMEAWCRHCPVGGRSAQWPQWKRRQHYETDHKRAAVAAKRAATREARREVRQEWAAAFEEAEEWLREELGEDPTPDEILDFAGLDGYVESSRASVRRRDRRHRSRRWLAARAPRPCRECEDTFTPNDPRQVFCSPKCQKRYARRVAKMAASNGDGLPPKGGQLATHDPRSDAATPVTNGAVRPPECAYCGEPFTPRRTDQHYCKPACRQAAYRQRKVDH